MTYIAHDQLLFKASRLTDTNKASRYQATLVSATQPICISETKWLLQSLKFLCKKKKAAAQLTAFTQLLNCTETTAQPLTCSPDIILPLEDGH